MESRMTAGGGGVLRDGGIQQKGKSNISVVIAGGEGSMRQLKGNVKNTMDIKFKEKEMLLSYKNR